MNEIMNATTQTPIEIALGIDENGMTTARNLFDFLEMNPANYARWVKRNITENEFAEEGVDYYSSGRKSEGKGNFSEDYKLTASFAKKLSMQQKNERGEQARNYFVGVENKAKDIVLTLKEATDNPMKLLELHYKALKEVDGKVNVLSDDLSTVRKDLEDLKDNMPILPIEAEKITNAAKAKGVHVMGGKGSNAYSNRSIVNAVYSDIYGQIYRNFGVRSYKAIKRNQANKAIEIIETYVPSVILQDRIEVENAQQTLNV